MRAQLLKAYFAGNITAAELNEFKDLPLNRVVILDSDGTPADPADKRLYSVLQRLDTGDRLIAIQIIELQNASAEVDANINP